ncbi:MAG: hypothetical protein AAFR90_03775 [Pseudomonadota bacterium]
MKIPLLIVAIVLIFLGLIILPMPIPFGAIMIVAGLVLLIYCSNTFARYIKGYRRRHPNLDGFIRKGQNRLPVSLQEIIKRTEP